MFTSKLNIFSLSVKWHIKAGILSSNKKLSGKMSDFYSIRINDQWRIVFKWEDGNANQVTIMDYHK